MNYRRTTLDGPWVRVVILSGRREVARHERSTVRESATLLLDHYLEVLAHKPGALPGATALVQARAAGTFTSAHEAFWASARRTHGDADGTRELVEVLVVGAARADVVAVEARRIAETRPTVLNAESDPGSEVEAESTPRVISLTERRLAEPAAVIAGLPPDQRPLPSVAAYDELLARRPVRSGDSDPIDSTIDSKGHVS